MLIISIIALISALADQITKLFVTGFFVSPQNVLFEGALKNVGDSNVLIDKILSFTYVLNKGAAFGILENQRIFFLLITTVICVAGIILLLRIPKKHWTLTVASGLIFGGAVGNMIDRVIIGQVRDFIEVTFTQTLFNYSFPVFNVADICVCVGTLLLAVYILFIHDKFTKSEKE